MSPWPLNIPTTLLLEEILQPLILRLSGPYILSGSSSGSLTGPLLAGNRTHFILTGKGHTPQSVSHHGHSSLFSSLSPQPPHIFHFEEEKSSSIGTFLPLA